MINPAPLTGSVDGALLDWNCENRVPADSASELQFDFTQEDSLGNVPPFPHPLRHPLRAVGWIVRITYGIASLIVFLAVIAAIPIVNCLALGYLLEVEGRIARNGKLRFAFPLLDIAPRVATICLGLTLWIFPLWLFAGRAADAAIIDPHGPIAENLRAWTTILQVLISVHLCLAVARGGTWGTFLRPIKNGRWLMGLLRNRPRFEPLPESGETYWSMAEARISEFVASLRLKHHFWLGLRGAFGAFLWLFLPTLLFAALKRTQGGQILVTIFGGLCLMWVYSWLPFLQARFAAENRLGAFRDRKLIRQMFQRAPIAWLIALIATCALALPYYAFKVRLFDPGAMWVGTVVFVITTYIARLITGWAYYRADHKTGRAHWVFRWTSRLLMVPALGAFVFILFFTQVLGEQGKATLFDHTAFLMPLLLR